MNDKVKKMLEQTITDKTTEEQFFEILSLPDNKFNAIYPDFKKSIEQAFKSNGVKKQMLEQLEMTPIDDIQSEIDGINNIIDEINSDDELSDNKKELLVIMIERSKDLLLEVIDNPREKIIVKVQKLNDDINLPQYAHKTDAGADIESAETITIEPNETKIVKTGLKVATPSGYMINIAPRSGLSAKTGLRIANSIGIIDSEFRGEVGIIITNAGSDAYTINKGDRIAQMLIMPTPMIQWEEVKSLDETERGEGGFGSTDSKS